MFISNYMTLSDESSENLAFYDVKSDPIATFLAF